MHDVDKIEHSTMIWKLIEQIICQSDARFLIRSVQTIPTNHSNHTHFNWIFSVLEYQKQGITEVVRTCNDI